jgi:hypothetical protein
VAPAGAGAPGAGAAEEVEEDELPANFWDLLEQDLCYDM